VNRALQNTSAWINMIERHDAQLPKGWQLPSTDKPAANATQPKP
jgi:hypothetical protein